MDEFSIILQNIPYVIAGTVGFIGLFVFRKIWKSMVNKRVRSVEVVPGMTMSDLDRMRKKGLLSEEEFRRVRGSVARQELEKEKDKKQIERDLAIIHEIEINPDAARELIDPTRVHQSASVSKVEPRYNLTPDYIEDTARPAGPQNRSAPPPIPAAAQYRPVAQPGNAPARPPSAQPSMNMPRVVQAKQEAAQPKAENQAQGNLSELDVLFQKGAISKEEYERLKKFFK